MKKLTTQTTLGTITGLEFEDHVEYRGIRYAKAERFCYPESIDSWTEPVDASEFVLLYILLHLKQLARV